MKFSEHLAAHLTPEWRKQYIRYEELKDLLYKATENAPQPEDYGEQQISRYFANFEEKFFQFCEKELSKINTFFYEKEAEAARTFAQLQDELRQVEAPSRPRNMQEKIRRKSSFFLIEFQPNEERENVKSNKRQIADLKLAFTEFYLSLVLIQNYQNLNFTGFRKILKKHDKMIENDKGADFRSVKVERASFYISKQVDNIIAETEALFTNNLADGDRQRAMNKLRVPPLVAKHTNWTTFFVGLYSGLFITVLCLLFSGMMVSHMYSDHFTTPSFSADENSTSPMNCSELEITWGNFPAKVDCADVREEWRPALRMYRGMFLLIFIIFLLGINTYGWRKAGVNHVLIFELDPRNNLSHEELLEVALFLGVLWAISVFSFLICYWLNRWSYLNPLALAVFMLLFLFNPTRTLKYRARVWLLKILSHIAVAPFYPVGFADFWLADQLNSLQCVLLDFEFLICFYSCEVLWVNSSCSVSCNTYGYKVRAIVASLPAWFRFAQCVRRYYDSRLAFPHLVNAGKYSTTFFVVIFSSLSSEMNYSSKWEDPFHYLWLTSILVSSCYTLTWDIKMDWGLLEGKAPKRFLREEVIYSEIVYYFAVVEDFILRFAWTIALSFKLSGILETDLIITIFAVLEVFRRFVWNFLRLENEHLNNCGQFRAVRDISIKPAKSNENNPVKVEGMMDDEGSIPLSKNKMSWERRKRIPNLCDDTMHIPNNCLTMQNPTIEEAPSGLRENRTSRVYFLLGDEEPPRSSSSDSRHRRIGVGDRCTNYHRLERSSSERSEPGSEEDEDEEEDSV